MSMRLVLSGALIVLMSACSSTLPVRHNAEELAGAVEELHNPDFLKRRNRATEAVKKRIDKIAPWLNEVLLAHYKDAPAMQVIRALLSGRLAVFELSEDAEEPTVTAPVDVHTIEEHLQAISMQTNWNYDIVNGVIYWSDMPTQVFKITYPQGQWQSQLGRSVQESSNNSLNESNQYTFLEHKVDLWKELDAGLKTVLQDYKFTLLPSVNSITVTAPPNYLRRVATLVERFNLSAKQRVLVELEIYLVDLSDSEQETLDWSFVRTAANGNRATIAQVAGNLANGLTPFTVSLNALSDGQYSGSKFIYNALAEQGAATVVSRPKLICLNNQVSELRLTRVTPYTSEVSYSTEQNIGSSRLTPNINTEEVVTGTTIYVLPTINGQTVNLSLSVNYTRINRFLNQRFGSDETGVNIQLPEYDDTQFTLPVALNSGETMVLAGNPRTIADAQDSGNRIPVLGRKRVANQRRTETVLLLTVHILDPA